MVAHSTGADDHVDLWTWPAKSKEGPGQLRRIDIPVATLDIDCVVAAVPVSTQFWKWSDFHFHVIIETNCDNAGLDKYLFYFCNRRIPHLPKLYRKTFTLINEKYTCTCVQIKYSFSSLNRF